MMTHVANLFLACILAGFALLYMGTIPFLVSLAPFFHIVGQLAILVFSFALIYLGLKALFRL